jgi:hypothetical protein
MTGVATFRFYTQAILKDGNGQNIHLMAFPAFHFFMFPFQWKFCSVVVKLAQAR